MRPKIAEIANIISKKALSENNVEKANNNNGIKNITDTIYVFFIFLFILSTPVIIILYFLSFKNTGKSYLSKTSK